MVLPSLKNLTYTTSGGAGGGEGVLVLRAPSVLKILGAPSPKGKKYQKMNFHFQCLFWKKIDNNGKIEICHYQIDIIIKLVSLLMFAFSIIFCIEILKFVSYFVDILQTS